MKIPHQKRGERSYTELLLSLFHHSQHGHYLGGLAILVILILGLTLLSFVNIDSGSPTSFNVLNTPELEVENQANQSKNISKTIETVTGYTVVDTADPNFPWTSLEDLAKTPSSRSLSLDAQDANVPGFVPLFVENGSQPAPSPRSPSFELAQETSPATLEAASETQTVPQQDTLDPLAPINDSRYATVIENASVNITHDNRNCDTTIAIDDKTVGSATISSFAYDCRIMLAFKNMTYLVEFQRSTPRDAYFSVGDTPLNLSLGNFGSVDLDHDAQHDVVVTLTYAMTGTANLFFEPIPKPEPLPVETSPAPVIEEAQEAVKQEAEPESETEEEVEESVPMQEESPAPLALQGFSQLTLYLILSILTLGIIVAVNYRTIQTGLKNLWSGNQQEGGLFQEPFQYPVPLNEVVLKSLIKRYIIKYQKLGYSNTAIRNALAAKYSDALLDDFFTVSSKPAGRVPLIGLLKPVQKTQTQISLPHDSLKLEDLIITYIRKYRREGHTDVGIKEQLLKRYPQELVDYCFFQA